MSSNEQRPAYSEPSYALSDKKKTDYPWYLPNIDNHLTPETRKFLEEYSKIAPEEQSKHVHEIRLTHPQRDQAWEIRSYPCTGLGVFLVPFISLSPAYSTILQRLKDGATFMDVGCFLGGDMRRLVFGGAPSMNMYGVDIVSHWDVGFALFRDKDCFDAHFVEADILSTDNAELQKLKGNVDIISISAVLHQWDITGQILAAETLVSFSKKGAIVVGYQIGNVEAKAVSNKAFNSNQWRHDPASFEKMWNQVGEGTGTRWKTEACLRSWESMGWDPETCKFMGEGDMVLDFVVWRMD